MAGKTSRKAKIEGVDIIRIMDTTLTAQNTILLDAVEGQSGRPFKARFLQAGLVKYDFGICLLQKETIDKFINTFVECPVIIDHKDNIIEADKVGVINKIWFSPEDGWFWCSGVLTTDDAVKKIEDGYNISCQYRITDYVDNKEGKLHNGNKYDKEILDGVFEHLAIVENPRYEGAFVAVNAYIAENADSVEEKEEKKENQSKVYNSIDINPIRRYIENYKEGETMDKETKGVFESLINALKARNETDEKDEKKEEKDAENKCKNADEDKRKLIDEVAGIMKSAGADDELIRTAIAKMEKLAYDKSEAGTADNEEKEKEEKKEEKPAENKCKNEDDEKYEELKEEVAKEAENKKAKNSLDALKSVFFDVSVKSKKIYMTQKEGIELGKKLY